MAAPAPEARIQTGGVLLRATKGEVGVPPLETATPISASADAALRGEEGGGRGGGGGTAAAHEGDADTRRSSDNTNTQVTRGGGFTAPILTQLVSLHKHHKHYNYRVQARQEEEEEGGGGESREGAREGGGGGREGRGA
jgi:hypothetical protein